MYRPYIRSTHGDRYWVRDDFATVYTIARQHWALCPSKDGGGGRVWNLIPFPLNYILYSPAEVYGLLNYISVPGCTRQSPNKSDTTRFNNYKTTYNSHRFIIVYTNTFWCAMAQYVKWAWLINNNYITSVVRLHLATKATSHKFYSANSEIYKLLWKLMSY